MKDGLFKLSIIALALTCFVAHTSDAVNVIPAQNPEYSVSFIGLYL